MANTDLSNYNLAELKGLQFDIAKEIKSRERAELKQARERILAIAQGVGVPVSALLPAIGSGAPRDGQRGGDGRRGPMRYRNPADSAQTWSGRGRRPKWVADALAGGKSLDDFRI